MKAESLSMDLVTKEASLPALEAYDGPLDETLRQGDLREQHRAVQLALHGSTWERLRYVLRQIGLLLWANDEVKLFAGIRLSLIMEIPKIPEKIAHFSRTEDGRRLLREQPRITRVLVKELMAAPATTLGGAYARFAKERNFDPEFYPVPAALEGAARFVLERPSQVHDLCHVVTGYDATVEGEGALLLFACAQNFAPFWFVMSIASFLVAGARDPRMVPVLVKAYRRGRRARDLTTVAWEELLDKPLAEVRRLLGLEPVSGRLQCYIDRAPAARA